MSDAGYAYQSRDETEGEFTQSEIATDLEIAVRLADIDCDLKLHLTEKRSMWEREKVDQWRSETAAQWDTIAHDLSALNDQILILTQDHS